MSYDVLEPILFVLLSVAILGAGLTVVLIKRVTSSALAMAFTFLCMAGMFVLLGAETVAAFQVLIYVGAITVLILYGVMFTPQRDREYALFFQRQTPWAAVFVAALALPAVVFAFAFRDSDRILARGGDLGALGQSLFRSFAFPFEVASFLPLAALVSAIVLVKREDEEETR